MIFETFSLVSMFFKLFCKLVSGVLAETQVWWQNSSLLRLEFQCSYTIDVEQFNHMKLEFLRIEFYRRVTKSGEEEEEVIWRKEEEKEEEEERLELEF